MNPTLMYTFVLIVLACSLSLASAYPAIYSIDRFDGDTGDLVEVDNTYDYRNSRLRRAYPYDDAENSVYYPFETADTPIRRQDTGSEVSYKYTPLVRYKSSRTERKKFFVPNIWG